MKSLRSWIVRIAAIFSREKREQELDVEMQSLLQLHTDENIRTGMASDEARRDAIARLQGIEPVKQAYRERDRFLFLEFFAQDLRFSIRQLFKYPGFSVTAILVLALGIGSSVAIFAFVDAALLKPLPYRDPARLLFVTESIPMMPSANLSYPDYLDWKRLNTVFSSFDLYGYRGFTMSTPAGAESVGGMRVSGGFFKTLGIAPALGRDFFPGEENASTANSVILTYTSWQRRFGGRPDVIGQILNLNDTAYTIIGVLPREFQFAQSGDAEFWAIYHPAGTCDPRRSCHSLEGIARLKDSVTLSAAIANMTLIAQQLEKQYPDSNQGQGAHVVPLTDAIVGDVRPVLLVLLCGVGLLLLIACVNVSSLVLVRSESRYREITIRGALGASRVRLVRQFLTESLVLVGVGGGIGLAFAWLTTRLLLGLISKDMIANMPYLQDLGFSSHVLAFAAAISLLAALLFSITPIIRIRTRGLNEALGAGGRGSAVGWRRFGGQLVVLELATAMVLLVGAGLLGKSLYRLLQVDLAFEPDHLAAVIVKAPDKAYAKDEQAVAMARQVRERIKQLPGVLSVATTSRLPVTSNGNTEWIRIVGFPYNGEHNEVNSREVSAEFFKTIQVRLLRGRVFAEEEDSTKSQVLIINQALAKKYFPGQDPIGKTIGDTELSLKSLRQIVGVVDDLRESTLDSDTWPAIYYPFNQTPSTYFNVIVRTSGSERAILPSLSAAIREVVPGVVTVGEISMNDRILSSRPATLRRSSAWLVGGFAALALLLGLVGIYGVLAYSVSQRTREIGVRVALGAQRVSIYGLILKDAGWLTALGIATGLVCSIFATTLLRGLLFGVSSWDLATLSAVAVVLAVSALLASYIPARRAASVDPIEALRAE